MNTGKVALITGASAGIGLATAVALSKQGYSLAITGPNEVEMHAALKKIPADPFAIIGDLNDLTFVLDLARQTVDRFGHVDLLVNNAAWRELFTMRSIRTSSWERTLRICLTAPAFLARELAVGMESRGSGVIVNISSAMANRGFAVATAYVAAKAGLDAVTRELGLLYGPSGVRVIGVAPGAVETTLSEDYKSSSGDDATAEIRAFSEQMIPAGRWATAEEVANAIVLLASSELTYLNGTTISFDGGWSSALYPRSIRERLTRDEPR